MKKLKCIFAIALTLLLTGCYPTGEFQYNSGTNSQDGEPVLKGENYCISAELPTDIPDTIPIVKMRWKTFDNEKMKDLFLGGEEITEVNSQKNGLFNTYVTEKHSLVIDNSWGRISCSATDDAVRWQGSYQSWIRVGRYVPKELPNSMLELENFPKEEAVSTAMELIEKLDLGDFGEPIIYSANADDMNSFFSAENKNSGLSSEDSFYYLSFPVAINGIAITDAAVDWNNGHANQANVDLTITKSRITDFNTRLIPESTETVGNSEIIIDAKAAAAKLAEYYKLSKPEDYYEFNQCKLRYITTEEEYEKGYSTYAPVWEFSGWHYIKSRGYSRAAVQFVDPKTGTVLRGL